MELRPLPLGQDLRSCLHELHIIFSPPRLRPLRKLTSSRCRAAVEPQQNASPAPPTPADTAPNGRTATLPSLSNSTSSINTDQHALFSSSYVSSLDIGSADQDWPAIFQNVPPSAILAALLTLRSPHQQQPCAALLDAAVTQIRQSYLDMDACELEAGVALPLLWLATRLRHPDFTASILDLTLGMLEHQRLSSAQGPSAKWLVSCLEAVAKLGEGEHALSEVVVQVLHRRARQLDIELTVRLLVCLSRLRLRPLDLLATIDARLERPSFLTTLPPPSLCRLIIATSVVDAARTPGAATALFAACITAKRDLTPPALSTLLWMLARRDQINDYQIDTFTSDIVRKIQQYTPYDLANVARAYAKLQVAPQPLFSVMAERATACVDAARPQDLLRIVTAYQQLDMEPVGLLDAVEAWADRRLASQPPQALSWAVWSFARMGNGSQRLLETAAQCAASQAINFAPLDLARTLWAFGSLQHPPGDELLGHAVKELVTGPHRFGDKGVANVLWALATLRYDVCADDLDAIAQGILPVLHSYNTQSAANVAWAFATFGHRPAAAALEKLGDVVAKQAYQAEPQALSLTAWSLATLGYTHYDLMYALQAQYSQRQKLREFEGQHLSNMLWGIAKMGIKLKDNPGMKLFVDTLAEEAGSRATELKPQEVFNVLWALATLKHCPSNTVLSALSTEVADRACAFSPQELSGSAWAVAKLHYPAGQAASMLQSIESELLTRVDEFETRHLSITIWALGQMRYAVTNPALQEALVQALRNSVSNMSSRGLATCLEGLVQLSIDLPPSLVGLIGDRAVRVAEKAQPGEFATICSHLVLLGDALTAESLLYQSCKATATGEKPPTLIKRAADECHVPGLILLLFTMACCEYYSKAAFGAVAQRISKTSPNYNITEAHLSILHEGLRRLEGLEEREQVQVNAKVLARAADAYDKSKEWLFRRMID